MGEQEQGATVAVPIWIDFMREALEGVPETTLERPNGIVDRLINENTGAPAIPGDQNAMFEYFRTENAPNLPNTDSPSIEESEVEEELSTETIF